MLLTGRGQRRPARRCQRVSALRTECGAAEAPCCDLGPPAAPTGLVGWDHSARVLHMLTLPPEPAAQSGARPPPRTAAHLLASPRGCSSGSARRGISTHRP